MKKALRFFVLGSLAVTCLQSPAYALQSGSVTYQMSGSSSLQAVTLNYDNRSVTWHYQDGYRFTQTNVDFAAVERWVRQMDAPIVAEN